MEWYRNHTATDVVLVGDFNGCDKIVKDILEENNFHTCEDAYTFITHYNHEGDEVAADFVWTRGNGLAITNYELLPSDIEPSVCIMGYLD